MDSLQFAPADPPLPRVRSLVLQPFLDTALALLVALLIGLAIALVLMARSGQFTGGDSSVAMILSEAPFLLVGIWRLRRNLRRHLVADALLTGDLQQAILRGLATGIGLLAVGAVIVSLLANVFGAQKLPRVLEQMFSGATGWRLVILVSVVAVIGPLAEELFFRAGMFAPLYSSGRFWLGAILSSAFFSLAHMNLLLSPYYFILGLILCGLFAATRNLIAPLIAHMTLNAAACAAFLLTKGH